MVRSRDELRFPGFSAATRAFYTELDASPDGSPWPDGARGPYAAHALGPLKALVTDLSRLLRDADPPLRLEARVGESLADEAGGPVRTLRAWPQGRSPDEAPQLFVTLTGSAIEIGLSSPDALPVPPAVAAHWQVEAVPRGIRVRRREAWEDWLDEPAFASEVAERFRELAPLLDGSPAPSHSRT